MKKKIKKIKKGVRMPKKREEPIEEKPKEVKVEETANIVKKHIEIKEI